MQSLTPPAGANIATTTPPGSPTQLKTPFHILQTAQTRNLHATELQRQLASFTNARIKLEAQADAFTARWGEGRVGPGVNPDAGHEALLKECRSTLGPAALAAVAPGGFRGALGGYASVQRVAAALSSASNGLARYMADRSTSPSAPPSPLSELVPKEILDRSPAHPEIDESHQPRATDSGSEANAKCGTEHEDHIEQSSQPHLPIGGPSGLLTKPQLWKPRDRKASMVRYGAGYARTASPPKQIKQDPDADTRAGASSSLLSIGALATLESPSVLAVERDRNSKLKRARNSAEDGDDDDEEHRRPRVKVKLESLDNIFGKGLHPRTRKQARATGSTTSTRLEIKNETPDRHTAYGLSSQGSSSTPFSLNTLPPMSTPTPAQLFTPISLAVERKTLKRARNSAGDDDDDDDEEEARKPRRRVKFEEAASASSDGAMTPMRAHPRACTPFPFVRRPAQSRSVAARLRRDSFGSISADGPRATAVSAPPAAVPLRRSARLQAKPKRIRMCAVCPEALNCHTHIS